MTKVTAAGASCLDRHRNPLYREVAQQFASELQQKLSKRLMILVVM
jgi:hypothetical protein